MAIVTRNGIKFDVKNLGWLLRHASEATEIDIDGHFLIVQGVDAHRQWMYETRFNDEAILHRWIQRRAFRHCELRSWTLPILT